MGADAVVRGDRQGVAAAHRELISGAEGRRHLASLQFRSLDAAKAFVRELVRRGLDISAQTYKADCPPAVLTKIPLIAPPAVADFIVEQMERAIRGVPPPNEGS
jgi:hypothetical protein